MKENRSNFDFDFNTAKLQHSEASTQLFHSESQGIALKFQYDAIKFHEPALYIKNKEEQAKRDKVSKTPDFVGLNKLLDINLMNPDVLVRMKSSNLLNGQGVVQTQRGWSFPEYFIEKWVQQESERQKARKEERKKRKEAKKRRMEQFPTQEKRVSASSKRATKGTWQDQYSSEIGIQNVKSKRRVTSQRNMVVTSSGAVDDSTGVKSFHTQKVKFLATEEGDEDEDVASPQLLGRKKPPPPPKPAPIPASDSTQSRTSPVQEVPETSSTKREEVESGGDVAAAVPEEYEQFQKMLTVGLPEPMVIGKIMQAGLDPSVLGLGGDGNKKPPAPPGKPKAPPGKPPGKPNGPRPAPPPKKETLGGGGDLPWGDC